MNDSIFAPEQYAKVRLPIEAAVALVPQHDDLHFPVVCDASGVKLSKQTGASGINIEEVTDIWARALRFLGQPDVTTNRNLRLDEIISLATQNWRIDPLRTKAQLP